MNWDALWRILGLCGVPPKLINLLSELYSGTESAVRYGDIICLGVARRRPPDGGQWCVLAPTLFSTCMYWILGRMSERSSCSASFGNVKISELLFADDAVIFAETRDILLGASRSSMWSQNCWDYGFPGSKLRSRL